MKSVKIWVVVGLVILCAAVTVYYNRGKFPVAVVLETKIEPNDWTVYMTSLDSLTVVRVEYQEKYGGDKIV